MIPPTTVQVPKRDTVQNERRRLCNNFGVDRWGSAYVGKASRTVHTTARSYKRQWEQRSMLTSGSYGGHHGDRMLREKGLVPPRPHTAQELAPPSNPRLGVTATAAHTGNDWQASTADLDSTRHEISADERIRLYTPVPSSRRLEPTFTGKIPRSTRRVLEQAPFQPSWCSTTKELSIEKERLDSSLPKNAKMDLRFHRGRSTGKMPQTGRFPRQYPEACYRANELEASLTTHWSHSLRGQKY